MRTGYTSDLIEKKTDTYEAFRDKQKADARATLENQEDLNNLLELVRVSTNQSLVRIMTTYSAI